MALATFTKKRRERGFTTVDNHFIDDNNLSYKAKGLLLYILRKPDGWTVRINDLIKRDKLGNNDKRLEGRDAVYGILKELIEKRYLFREEIREKGKFKGYNYIADEIPMTEMPYTDKPDTANPEPINNNKLIKTDCNKQQQVINCNKREVINSGKTVGGGKEDKIDFKRNIFSDDLKQMFPLFYDIDKVWESGFY